MSISRDAITPLFLASKAAWRRWLREHHVSQTEVWLAIQKKGSLIPGVTLDEAIEEALCFGWIDGKMFSRDEDCYVLRFTPRNPKSIWSASNKKRILELMKAGKMHAAGLATVSAARKSGAWSSAYSLKQDRALPADMKRALMKNATAWANFRGFPKGARNMFIIWVTGAKMEQTRLKRIEETVRMSLERKKLG
jgi:uncharacterized protein YdeI (YjbR/CyaY-like superfamily)